MTIRKFYGCAENENDAVVNEQHFKKNAEAFFNNGPSGMNLRQPEGQSLEKANEIFFGVETKKKGH